MSLSPSLTIFFKSYVSGLLQDSTEYLEVHLDEVWKPSDHWRSEEACDSCWWRLWYCWLDIISFIVLLWCVNILYYSIKIFIFPSTQTNLGKYLWRDDFKSHDCSTATKWQQQYNDCDYQFHNSIIQLSEYSSSCQGL